MNNDSEIKKIAITGASGHVGACLCRDLIKRGYNVKVLFHKDDTGFKGLDIEIIKGDLLDKDSLGKLVRDSDAVIHLGAVISINGGNTANVIKTNVDGTRNILECSLESGITRFIHFSSVHALESKPLDKQVDETRPLITSSKMIYETTKAESERLVAKAVKSGLNAVVLNPSAIIGPCDYKPSYLGLAIMKIAQNKLPMLVPGGYNYVDVRDVSNAAVAAITKGRSGERYILSGNWHSLKEISEMTAKITGGKTPKIVCPTSIAKLGVPFIKFYAKIFNEEPLYTYNSLNILKESNKNISNLKAQKELGYSARPLYETLKDTLEWFKENGYMD
jgi:dihydroflavonol-4-reductase